VEPVEGDLAPLPHVEQRDDPHQVERLDRDEADQDADQLVQPRRREGEHRGDQDDHRLDAVAARRDRHREAVLRLRMTMPSVITSLSNSMISQPTDARPAPR
jgi:hypothetical protein